MVSTKGRNQCHHQKIQEIQDVQAAIGVMVSQNDTTWGAAVSQCNTAPGRAYGTYTVHWREFLLLDDAVLLMNTCLAAVLMPLLVQ
jgi:hypothetical protein